MDPDVGFTVDLESSPKVSQQCSSPLMTWGKPGAPHRIRWKLVKVGQGAKRVGVEWESQDS